MESLIVLIPLSVVLVLVALKAFLWAAKSGQFEDLDREAARILEEDDFPDSSSGRP
ncbi:MAG: cbb3-type cytochrome oxidase assembly protein CcoS [Pseudomonadales bacterium]|nr:cbb3-type cytochrome oxidase assembly protein CcoS [Pseudomonadales bacterium]MBL6808471.1 cbb3-type cytochrome oxidase assembly protein CcoS [Pseudomonadales bacterium]MDA0955292.1 cbb3-type cytochrome oxidase assembly protein CcoS [Pseudomonadota bacterium]